MNLAEFVEGRRDQHLAELCEFLRIPSVSAKSEHKPDIERGANWVAGNLRAAGFKNVEIVPTGLHPLVYAESLEAPGKPTILFYGHYDVQPPEPLIVSDTSMLGKGVPSITYGLRGLNYYQIELTGPERDLHSGVYGGAVPNPLTILTELFAKLHDKNFRVTVPGFYDSVAKVSNAERKSLNALPWKKKDFEKAVGAPGYFGEKGFTTVERLWTRPTFELNGLWGGYQGEGAKTVIPSNAFAKFSTRLVPNHDPHNIAKLVANHIRKLLPKTVHCKFEILSTCKTCGAPYYDQILEKAQPPLEKRCGNE